MKHILLLNGPNLNLLGKREPNIYGSQTLAEIEQSIIALGAKNNIKVTAYQSNSESELIEKIHNAIDDIDYIIFNPAAYTHTSIALRDALLAVNIPFIEVHLSDISKREKFRQHSYFSDIAQKVITGFGFKGYEMAFEEIIKKF